MDFESYIQSCYNFYNIETVTTSLSMSIRLIMFNNENFEKISKIKIKQTKYKINQFNHIRNEV